MCFSGMFSSNPRTTVSLFGELVGFFGGGRSIDRGR